MGMNSVRVVVRIALIAGEGRLAGMSVRSRDGEIDMTVPVRRVIASRMRGDQVAYFAAQYDSISGEVEVEERVGDQTW